MEWSISSFLFLIVATKSNSLLGFIPMLFLLFNATISLRLT
jgi:hypothetical protein